MNLIRTRFAPSPTGYLHIGGVRTALFSWLYARHHGGQFILRIEDTDKERSSKEAMDIILEGMQWLGLDYDEGPFYQTERGSRYEEVIQQLLDTDNAYHCYCSKEELDAMRQEAMAKGEKPKYNGKCRNTKSPSNTNIKPVVRFKNPLSGEVIINDLIQGTVSFQNTELDDLIIARSDGSPTYNLTVVVDDLDMAISHVIRGDDHLNNTPRQMNIFAALDASPPVYAHVPLILGADGKKLSKRHDTVNILHYRKEGFLPEALINYLVRLGWSYGDQEIFSLDEMVKLFDIVNVNKAAAAVNPEKLLWLNQHYLKSGNMVKLTKLLDQYFDEYGIDTRQGPTIDELLTVQKERCKTFKDIAQQSHYFYEETVSLDEKAAKKHLSPDIVNLLSHLRNNFDEIIDWTNEHIHQVINNVADEYDLKLGKIAQPLRVAVTGTTVSPSIDDTLRLLGKEKTLSRLDGALEYIRQATT